MRVDKSTGKGHRKFGDIPAKNAVYIHIDMVYIYIYTISIYIRFWPTLDMSVVHVHNFTQR